jgi:uncharacterized membrane protein
VPAASQSTRRAAGIVAVAGALVLGTWARFVVRSPLWLDEALTVNIAAHPLGELREALLRDGHPPLYYWLLHGWMELFGQGDLAVRSLSAVFGLATLPLVWLLGRRAGGPAVAWGSLALAALSPYAVRYSSETRMYALVMLLVAAGALLLDRLLTRASWPAAIGLAVVTGALLWTHYWGLYLAGVVGLALLAAWRWRPARRRELQWAVGSLVAGGVLFLPWVPSLLEQAEHTGTPWAIPARPTQVLQTTLGELGGGLYAEALLLGTLLAIAGTFVFVRSGRGDDEPELAGSTLQPPLLVVVSIATLAVGWAVAYATEGAYAGRYAAVIAPFLLVAVAAGVARAPVELRALLAVGLFGLSALAVVHNVGYLRTQAGDITALLAEHAEPTDVIVVCPDQLGPDLVRSMDQRGLANEVLVYPDDTDPRTVDWRDYEERNRDNDPGGYVQHVLDRTQGTTVWVVWQGGYRTLLEQCEAVVEGLADARNGTIVARNGPAFEAASLWRIDG